MRVITLCKQWEHHAEGKKAGRSGSKNVGYVLIVSLVCAFSNIITSLGTQPFGTHLQQVKGDPSATGIWSWTSNLTAIQDGLSLRGTRREARNSGMHPRSTDSMTKSEMARSADHICHR
ncbi:hypothetical protein K437DRAFT_256576 [Tilletiaria anomala UBC 951]|uniref:Uncharacterized protein n=1 Tax=Tilletiaria anomala (strain ATCC 24038 / CBS 436.72 / UBC 951) TaxID=1037660 RepID=A0A066W3W8_TILAU|nr:uncharacterized protein K437DRAFT_256576 [Tilletiaria anomala UBC 951]KDN45460.1 hypothetical protein K437DRAFT_256576 [Tilletiaria anomala UBC 951]